jgi:hypothetical protein
MKATLQAIAVALLVGGISLTTDSSEAGRPKAQQPPTWLRLFGGSGSESPVGFSLSEDGAPFVVYSTDSPEIASVDDSIATAMTVFNREGQPLHTTVLAHLSGVEPSRMDLAGGELYVTTAGESRSRLLAKYTGSGTFEWMREVGAINQAGVLPIAVSGDGGAYLGGSAAGRLLVERYSPEGTPEWSRLLGEPPAGTRAGGGVGDMALATGGALVVAGSSNGATSGDEAFGGLDAVVAQYTPDGELEWVARFGTARDEVLMSVTVARDGSILVAGFVATGLLGDPSDPRDFDLLIARLSPAGRVRWSRVIERPNAEIANGVAVGDSGLIHLAVTVRRPRASAVAGEPTTYDEDIAVVTLRPAGRIKEWRRLAGPRTDLAVDVGTTDDRVLLLGTTNSPRLTGVKNHGRGDIVVAAFPE